MKNCLNRYRIFFKDILTFLGLDYKDDSLITMYFVCGKDAVSPLRLKT